MALAREQNHDADHWAPVCGGAGAASPGGAGRDRGAAHAGDLVAGEGRGVLDVAGVLGFAPRWVEQLAARCNAQGADALGDRRRGNGRAARVLTTAVLAALAGRLRAPPEDGARWTGAKVATWMAAQLGLERVRPQRGWEALTRIGWSVQAPRPQAPRPRHPRAATPEQRAAGSVQRGLDAAVARARAAHPDQPVEAWAEDERRLGLKPIRRRAWAPIGKRAIALGHRRRKRLHVTACVQPTSGAAVWLLSTGLSKPLFEALLARFAQQVGAGGRRRRSAQAASATSRRRPTTPAGTAPRTWPSLTGSRWRSCRHTARSGNRSCNRPSDCGPWSTNLSPTGTSPPWTTSTPSLPSAAVASTLPPSSRTPTSTGGQSQFRRTD